MQVSQRYTMAMQLRQSALISKWHLRILKLGQLLATLSDQLALVRQNKLPHADFPELPLSDEVSCR